MDQETLARLRDVLIEVLDDFALICEENNLTYFMTGGTLLGAVRHKGFIPWDDDIDVAMPRNDYDKFVSLIERNTYEKYYIWSYKIPFDTSSHNKAYVKFCKKGTVCAGDYKGDPQNYNGIKIDIWPFDKCTMFFLPLQATVIKLVYKLYRLKSHIDVPQKKFKLFICKLLCFFFSMKFVNKLQKKISMIYNKRTSGCLSNFAGTYGYKRETQNYDTIFPLVKLFFEGKYYCAPGNWDDYLKTLYDGDYMELPPVEQRRIHGYQYIVFNAGDIYDKRIK